MTEHEMRAATAPSPGSRLGRLVLTAYSAPAFAQAFLMGPAISVIQGIYAKHFGLGLKEIALVLLVARIFNGVSDPVIGFLSDNVRVRVGSRKPWLLAGAVVAVFACWFLYVPAGKVTTLSFLVWFLLADVGWSMSAVPYTAWMAELTDDYGERARISSWRAVGTYVGTAAFLAMPTVAGWFIGSTEFTPATLRWAAIFAAVALPGTAIAAAALVPNGSVPVAAPGNPFRGVARAVAGNRPLALFLAMFAVGGLGSGMGWGLMYFYIDGYLQLGAKMSILFVITLPMAILAAPQWGGLCRRFGKQRMWAVGYAGSALASLAFIVLKPGPHAAVVFGGILLFFNAMVVVEGVAAPAVLADIVDYGRWRFGADHGGTYFALFGMVTKINIGIGAAIGLALAGAFGFDPRAATQTAGGMFGLLFSIAGMPALCYAIAVTMILKFPIDRRRQEVIVKAIERRERRARASADAAKATA